MLTRPEVVICGWNRYWSEASSVRPSQIGLETSWVLDWPLDCKYDLRCYVTRCHAAMTVHAHAIQWIHSCLIRRCLYFLQQCPSDQRWSRETKRPRQPGVQPRLQSWRSNSLVYPSTEKKLDNSTQFWLHNNTLFVKRLRKKLGVRPNFGGPGPPTSLVVAPMETTGVEMSGDWDGSADFDISENVWFTITDIYCHYRLQSVSRTSSNSRETQGVMWPAPRLHHSWVVCNSTRNHKHECGDPGMLV